MLLRIVGTAILILFVNMSAGGEAWFLIDLVTFFYILGMHFSIMLIQFGSGVFSAWKAVFSRNLTEEDRSVAAQVWRRAASVFIGVGILIDVLGTVTMGATASDSIGTSDILRASALSLLGTFWGMVLSFGFCTPIAHYVDSKRLAGTEPY